MKKKKVLFWVLTCSILCIASVFIVEIIMTKSNKSQRDAFDDAADIMMKSFPTDIVIIGKDLPFDERFEHRCIDRITEETLENKKQFQIIIINDFEGSLEINAEEFLILKDRVFSGKSDVYYLGRQYFSKLLEVGLIVHPSGDNDYAVGMVSYNGGVRNSSFWRTEDINATGNSMTSLCQVLVGVFVDEIRERYQ